MGSNVTMHGRGHGGLHASSLGPEHVAMHRARTALQPDKPPCVFLIQFEGRTMADDITLIFIIFFSSAFLDCRAKLGGHMYCGPLLIDETR